MALRHLFPRWWGDKYASENGRRRKQVFWDPSFLNHEQKLLHIFFIYEKYALVCTCCKVESYSTLLWGEKYTTPYCFLLFIWEYCYTNHLQSKQSIIIYFYTVSKRTIGITLNREITTRLRRIRSRIRPDLIQLAKWPITPGSNTHFFDALESGLFFLELHNFAPVTYVDNAIGKRIRFESTKNSIAATSIIRLRWE